VFIVAKPDTKKDVPADQIKNNKSKINTEEFKGVNPKLNKFDIGNTKLPDKKQQNGNDQADKIKVEAVKNSIRNRNTEGKVQLGNNNKKKPIDMTKANTEKQVVPPSEVKNEKSKVKTEKLAGVKPKLDKIQNNTNLAYKNPQFMNNQADRNVTKIKKKDDTTQQKNVSKKKSVIKNSNISMAKSKIDKSYNIDSGKRDKSEQRDQGSSSDNAKNASETEKSSEPSSLKENSNQDNLELVTEQPVEINGPNLMAAVKEVTDGDVQNNTMQDHKESSGGGTKDMDQPEQTDDKNETAHHEDKLQDENYSEISWEFWANH
jgi:hypothetical protein